MRDRLILVARVAIVVIAAAVSIARFLAIDADSHSVSDTLRPWFIETALIAVVAGVVLAAIGRLAPRAG
jgi:hypothetical protein